MNLKKYISILLFLFVLLSNVQSQKVVISGFITDSLTGENLLSASINYKNSTIGTTTNSYGYYSITLDSGKEFVLNYSHIGYKSIKKSITLLKDSIVNISMLPGVSLNEVTVLRNQKKNIEELPEHGKILIPLDQIKLIPNLTGESDILKAYQLMPGVQGGMEGQNGIYVRGGTPDQNLFLLDDVPLYNVSHLGGLYSVFDPSMIKEIDFYKGGFPARYGGRTSSVIDIRNKDGNMFKTTGELEISLLLSKFFIEGPIKKGNSTFAFSIRRSNIDLFSYIYGLLQNNGYYVGYTFYDINTKFNLRLSDKDRLITNFYSGRDKFFYINNKEIDNIGMFEYNSGLKQRWGNLSLSTRWQHVFKPGVFHNLTAAYTSYFYDQTFNSQRTSINDDSSSKSNLAISSGIKDLILKSDLEISLNNNRLRTGMKANYQIYNPTSLTYSEIGISSTDETHNKTDVNSYLFSGYIEFIFQQKNLTGNLGLHTSYYFIDNKTYNSLEPRIVLNYLIIPSFSLKLSGCSMQQNIHLLTNSYTGLPTDLWVPSTGEIEPETSKQISIGIAHTSSKNIEFSIETFYKQLENLISYKEGIMIFSNNESWDKKVETEGKGYVKGIEFLAQKKNGDITGWVGYTLSSNYRQFQNINYGKKYPFKYDQRHEFSTVINWKASKRWSYSCTWLYHTGHAVTLPSGQYQLYQYNYKTTRGDRIQYVDVHNYSEKNGYRMPDYHRLDIGCTFTKKKLKGKSVWKFGIYNVYSRQNAYYVFFKEENETTNLYQQSIFPIFVNIGYSYHF